MKPTVSMNDTGVPDSRRRRAIRNLPLFWKLLIPFLVLMLLLGGLGGFLIVRDLSSRAETALDQDLSRRSLEVRSLLRDRELSLIESVNLAANLVGMSEAVQAKDRGKIAELLGSVLALKTQLNVVVIADETGRSLVDFARTQKDTAPIRKEDLHFSAASFVRSALQDPAGAKFGGLLATADEGGSMFSVAGAVCSQAQPCAPVGVAVVGIGLEELSDEAATQLRSITAGRTGVAIYRLDGREAAASGLPTKAGGLPELRGSGLERRTYRGKSGEVATLYFPLEIQGQRQGTISVTVPTEGAFASARGAGLRLSLVLAASLIGVVGLGVLLSRLILAQVRPLVVTNRALRSGDLSARAPVLGNDELGELARGVNEMAEELEANVETLETRVAERTAEVQRLLSERTEFFATLSHEFRTPLAVILREAEMMLNPNYPKTSRWAAQTGRTIRESGRQLLFFINDIIDLAKAEAGGLEVNLEKVRLQEVLREARRTISELAEEAGLSLSVRIPRDLPAVRADRTRLREVILNLVDNAVKYTPAGGRVKLTAAAHNGQIAVSVSDTGVGIPPQDHERIFEPFFRVEGIKAQRGQASSGLGLALTRRLVEAHGGEIELESEPGSGTTVTFTLPAA